MKRLCVIVALLIGWAVPASAQGFAVEAAAIPSLSVGCVFQVQSLGPTVIVCGSAGSGTVTGSGTTDTIAMWTSAGAVGNSGITKSGTVYTAATWNASTAFTIGGASINTVGTLGNVCYNSQACTITGGNITGLLEANITDGSILARLAANETVTGAWTFDGGVDYLQMGPNVATWGGRLGRSSSTNMVVGIPGTTASEGFFVLDSAGAQKFDVLGDGLTTVRGLFAVTAFGTHTLSASGTGANRLAVANTSTTNNDFGRITVAGGSNTLYLSAFNQNQTTSGFTTTSRSIIESDGAGGLAIIAGSTGDLLLASRGVLALTLGASQAATFTGHVSVAPTKGYYVDGGGDSYIVETSANVVRVVAGGSGGVDLTSGATSWAAVSDQRLKTDLSPITSAAWKLGQIRALTGRYTADAPDVRRSFLIAQDVRAVLPEAVSTLADGMFTLRYTDVIPLLVGGVNEIEARLSAIEKRLGVVVSPKDTAEDAKIAAARDRVDRVAAAERARVQAEAAEAEKKRIADAAAKAEADKRAAADKVNADIQTRIASCEADNAVIVQQGGKALACATTAEEKAVEKMMREAEKAAADQRAKDAKQGEAACLARNQKIIKQGGKPLVCGGV